MRVYSYLHTYLTILKVSKYFQKIFVSQSLNIFKLKFNFIIIIIREKQNANLNGRYERKYV